MSVQFLNLKQQYEKIKAEIDAAVMSVVSSGAYILGPNVTALESEIAQYTGTAFAVGLASGTDALLLALKAVGVGAGDEVITTPFTFVATIEAIAYLGAKPVFADIDLATYNIDPISVAAKITAKTKAILPVHLYGYPADMDSIMQLAQKHDLKVVEDCAQAIGTRYRSRHVGGFSDAGCFSFFPTKNMGAMGDGGMVIAQDKAVADELKVLRGHGSRKTYYYDVIGYNSRLDEIQAAVLRVKLKYISRWNQQRRANAELYAQHLKGLPLTLPPHAAEHEPAFHQYTIRTPKRDALQQYLKNNGITAMIYYPLSLHLQSAYAYLGNGIGSFPSAETADKEVLSLPIHQDLTSSEIEEVCRTITDFFKR